MNVNKSWIAHCKYPDLNEFVFGTIFTNQTEGEETARQKIIILLDEIFPIRPNIISIIQGAIYIKYENED